MKTIADLEAALAQRFTCVDGPAKAWFNIEDDPKRPVIYQSFGLRSTGPDPDEVHEERLVIAMWAVIENALEKHSAEHMTIGTTLYWRIRPVMKNDGSTFLRMRFGIEGFSAIGHNPTREEAGE